MVFIEKNSLKLLTVQTNERNLRLIKKVDQMWLNKQDRVLIIVI